jgi:hypothetical protein
MHHGIDAVGLDDRGEPAHVANVADLERRTREAGGGAMPGAQIVVDDDIVAGRAEGLHGVAADVARAAGHEHAHRRPIE